MSDPHKHRTATEQPLYIVWVLLFVFGLSTFQIAVPIGLYIAFYGMPTFGDIFSSQVIEYSHSAMWKGRVWHPVLKIGPNNPTGKATLSSFDPEKGDVRESGFKVSFPLIGILADGDRLWAVSSNSVTCIEDDVSVEFKPIRLLSQTSEPFLYESQLAVVDVASGRIPTLLVFDENEWSDAGKIAIPFGFEISKSNGQKSLIPSTSNAKVSASLMDVKVVSVDGQFDLFVSDGSTIIHKHGLELEEVSALAPENAREFVDLSNLSEWEIVYSTSAGLGRAGVGRLGGTGFKIGMVNGEPFVITVSSSNANPFQGNSLIAFRRIDNEWEEISELPTQALMSLLVVTDGQKTYVSGQSYAQMLRVNELTETELKPNGVVLKAPVVSTQVPVERWSRIYQWVYWPTLLILALGVSRLMTAYLSSEYQFGLTDVELASITRRGIARIIDTAVFWIPVYLLFVASGMSSQEQVAENLDKIFDLSKDGMLVRVAKLYLCVAIWGLVFLFAMSLAQAIWGVTLGKWICGIRTVRTTLRPCGFPRALVRELLIVADTLFGSSFIPVTLAIAFSSCRQRLGDMVADTIVIRKRKTLS